MHTSPSRLLIWLPCLAVVCLFPASVFGQATTKLAWDYTGPTVAAANAYQHTVLVDGAAVPGAVICVAAVAPSTAMCTIPAPAMAAGAHTMVVTARSSAGTNERTTTATVDPSQAPGMPSRFRFLIEGTITVTPVP